MPLQEQSSPTTDTIESNNEQQQNNSKIFEMSTYVQLEIDNNNPLCIPRTCKFTIKQLVIKRELIQQLLLQQSSTISSNLNQPQQLLTNPTIQSNILIIAIKLHFNKRILRTIEIPLNKLIQTQQNDEQNISINLNLLYNISYSHYLKKTTNFLFIYIQRRKKYKNRTILGYKSLAIGKIDLQAIMQKTYNIDLLLETVNNNQQLLLTSTLNNPTNSSSSSSNNKYQSSIMIQTSGQHDINQLQQQFGHQICGYLTINSLCSQSFDYQTNNSDHEQQNELTNKKDELCGDDDEEQQQQQQGTSILTNVFANLTSKNKSIINNRSINSDSEIEFDPTTDNPSKLKQPSKSRDNGKKFTGKLISFIRKLRINDDINSSSSPNRNTTTSPIIVKKKSSKSANNTINEDDEENISDFSENNSIGSDCMSEIEVDKYSIRSTPKPSLQPFFKPILNEYNECDADIDLLTNDSDDGDYHSQSPKRNTTINSELITKTLDNTLLNTNQSPLEISYYLVVNGESNSFYSKLKETCVFNNLFLLNEFQRDLKILFETLVNWFLNNKQKLLVLNNKKYQYYNYSVPSQQLIQIKIILFGNDQLINQFLRVYVEIFKTQDLLNLFKFYFIPYYSTSTQNLAKLLNQIDSNYQLLFGDDYWLQLDFNLQYYDFKDVLQRIQRFIKYSSQTFVQLQICEVMINNYIEDEINQQLNENEPLFNIPFILDVKIGNGFNEQTNEFEQVLLQSSPSHVQSSKDFVVEEDSVVKSPPNSPFPEETQQENDYNLQVDYWVSSFGQNQQQTNINQTNNQQQQPQTSKELSQQLSSSSGSTKITKSTTKGLFKYLNVSKINPPVIVQQYGPQETPINNNLSLSYVIKEKKQKSKFLSTSLSHNVFLD
jgi:hypothetical protein